MSSEELLADYFFIKGNYQREDLFEKIAELISEAPMRANAAKPDRAPVWVPRSAEKYFVIICTDCLRSFSIPEEEASTETQRTSCPFCGVTVRFLADPRTISVMKES